MDHPLTDSDSRKLRQRVVDVLKTAYSVKRDGNIIFVCGGNKDTDMRPRFKQFCEASFPDLQIFFPEFAMRNYFDSGVYEPFNIADFEALIGDLSHAIVLFPEAAGSFAEVGYFSLISGLASKTILALDVQYQSKDSFISLGPADKFNKQSRFNDIMQLSYDSPDFSQIIDRINRVPFPTHKRSLKTSSFSDLSNYALFCLIHKIYDLLVIATIDDIIFILRSMFQSQLSIHRVKQITSILIGSEMLQEIGSYGHYYTRREKGQLAFARDGFAEGESTVKLEISDLIERADTEFQRLAEQTTHAV